MVGEVGERGSSLWKAESSSLDRSLSLLAMIGLGPPFPELELLCLVLPSPSLSLRGRSGLSLLITGSRSFSLFILSCSSSRLSLSSLSSMARSRAAVSTGLAPPKIADLVCWPEPESLEWSDFLVRTSFFLSFVGSDVKRKTHVSLLKMVQVFWLGKLFSFWSSKINSGPLQIWSYKPAVLWIFPLGLSPANSFFLNVVHTTPCPIQRRK